MYLGNLKQVEAHPGSNKLNCALAFSMLENDHLTTYVRNSHDVGRTHFP